MLGHTHKIAFFVFVFVFLYAFTHENTASAQLLPAQNTDIYISSDPPFPTPFTETTLSLDDYSQSSLGATITWYIDGVEQKNVRNEHSIQVESGDLGEKQVVTARLSRNGIAVASATYTIQPITITIILEANTYVPSFYKGRALPSADSVIRAIALVNDNSNTAQESYSYKWRLNETVFYDGPVKGRNTAVFSVPHFGDGKLSLEVYDTLGKVIGEEQVTIKTVQPIFHFYEESPLRGLSGKAITSTLPLIGDETTVRAEPYYLNTQSIVANVVDFVWKLNNKVVTTDVRNAITLGRQGNAGNAQVTAEVSTKERVPQRIQDSFKVTFE